MTEANQPQEPHKPLRSWQQWILINGRVPKRMSTGGTHRAADDWISAVSAISTGGTGKFFFLHISLFQKTIILSILWKWAHGQHGQQNCHGPCVFVVLLFLSLSPTGGGAHYRLLPLAHAPAISTPAAYLRNPEPYLNRQHCATRCWIVELSVSVADPWIISIPGLGDSFLAWLTHVTCCNVTRYIFLQSRPKEIVLNIIVSLMNTQMLLLWDIFKTLWWNLLGTTTISCIRKKIKQNKNK